MNLSSMEGTLFLSGQTAKSTESIKDYSVYRDRDEIKRPTHWGDPNNQRQSPPRSMEGGGTLSLYYSARGAVDN